MSARTRLASRAQLGRELTLAHKRIESLEAQLRQLSRHEELLLHELNHRVGNNLAVLLGILDRERPGAESGGGTETSLKVSRFILGFAVVHRMLAETGWRPLRLATLCRAVLESVVSGVKPTTRVRVADSTIEVPSRVADRIAVVLSELALNSLRHCQGLDCVDLEVSLQWIDEQIVLEYRDSGPGYPRSVLDERGSTGGLGLVSEVTRHGLDGRLTLSNDSGARATLTFSGLVSSCAPPGAAREGAGLTAASPSGRLL